MKCLFCESDKFKFTDHPNVEFNNKKFSYKRCINCNLIVLDPILDNSDLLNLYPISYQIVTNQFNSNLLDETVTGLRFSYRVQHKLIEKYSNGGKELLDYGCGNGHFINAASNLGYKLTGVEYNPDFLIILKEQLPQANFFSVDEILNQEIDKKFDVIRLSNVLEHLVNPSHVIEQLKNYLSKDGIFIIEGPVEDNLTLVQLLMNLYFKFRRFLNKKNLTSNPPYHTFFSNRINQTNFFINRNLEQVVFLLEERDWPFVSDYRKVRGIKLKLMSLIVKLSIFISRNSNGKLGNTFLYIGKNRAIE